MDGIKQRRIKGRVAARRHARASVNHAKPVPSRARKLVRGLGKVATTERSRAQRLLSTHFIRHLRRCRPHQIYASMMLLLFLLSVVIAVMQPYMTPKTYALSDSVKKLIPSPTQKFGDLLKLDQKTASFEYNAGYDATVNPDSAVHDTGSPRINASFPVDPSKGISITDPAKDISFSMKPKFPVADGKQSQNQIIYPLGRASGYMIYTSQAEGVKEDIVLNNYAKNRMVFDYELDVSSGLEPRLETNGSLGVYGSSLPINGNVSTGSDSDKQLLEAARKKAKKDRLIFTIPAPVVKETDKDHSDVHAYFDLDGNTLKVIAEKLKGASYPLTIDPSIYLETASKLMAGNNDTNIDFDVTNELIQKGKTTGARFDSWGTTMALPAARWNGGTAVAGGYIYQVGGNNGTSNQSTVYWAKFNTSTYTIDSPNPGAGACANWCNNSAYDLPAARAGLSVVAYNGYLYAIGGLDGSNVRTSTVYYAKIGANGEPISWSTTTALSVERSYSAAVVYNNRMYLLGGQTTASSATPTGVTTVQEADMLPGGGISAWTTTGMVALTSARYGHNALVYNDRMYVVGGTTAGTTATLLNTVQYIKINSDGTMSGSWTTTSAFTSARMTWGGNNVVIWGGYMYITGGCTALTTNNCSTIAGDIQLASINADGTLTPWNSISGVTSARQGFGFVAWRNTLYAIGGCTAQNTGTGACTTTATLDQYGQIKTDGEASTVNNSVPSGTSPCVTTGWTQCDMPPVGTGAGQGGQMSGGAVINNGFIYYIGGCTAVGNNSVCFTGNAGKATGNISYSAIASDGSLTRTGTCSGTFSGSWCVDSTNTLNTGNGLAAFGYTIFNNVIYAIGGTTGTQWQDLVWRNPLNSNGTLGTWTSQTFTNLGLGNAKGYQYAFTRANPSSAGTYPGNLYVLGGCSGVTAADNGLDCTGTIYTEVYKCNIKTDGSLETTTNICTTTGQLQIDSEPGTGGTQGLGVMAGTVYANYIYLIGGQSINESERGEVMYAKIDNSNNIVAVSGSDWITSANSLSPARRRGVAFGYNGYLYALAGYNTSGGGSLNDLLFAKVNVSDGSVGAFTTSQVTVNARWDLRAIVNNGYVYTFGGCSIGTPPASCTGTTATIQTFQLYNNYSGSPASYAAGANLFTTDRIGAGATILNGYIYIVGGCTSATDCTTTTATAQSAAIDSVGAIGSWTSTTVASLGAATAWGKLVAAGGTLYYVGGQNNAGTAQTTVYYSSTPSSGSVSSWTAATNGLPAARTELAATVWDNRIYVAGGQTGGTSQATVYASMQLTSGGNITTAWTTTNITALGVARSGATLIAYANNLYVLGGFDGTNYLNDVQYASLGYKTGTIAQTGTTVTGTGTTFVSGQVGSILQYPDGSVATITAFSSTTSITVSASKSVTAGSTYVIQDGSVGAWTYSTSLPLRLRAADGFAANGFMYLFGGRSAATTCDSKTLVAPISANTTIATGNNPTGIGEWYETSIKYTGSRYGAAAAYADGKAYLLGGGCGATLTYTSTQRVVQTTLQSQPQVAKYSYYIDSDTNVFPNSWLMNGIDNSIGARWNFKYRSAANGWSYRRKITLNNTASGTNLTDFPIRVSLSSSNIDYTKTQNSGQDIRFYDSDGVTALKYEIERWDETGTSEVWVKVPQVDAGSSTDYIYMYYGNNAAADAQDASNVWSNSYAAVYHMKEDPSGSAPQIRDSTSNARHGTSGGSMTTSDVVNGKIGKGLDFDGNDYIQITGTMGNPAQASMEAWASLTTADSNGSMIVSPGDYLGLFLDANGPKNTRGYYYPGAGIWNDTGIVTAQAGGGMKFFSYTNNPSGSSQKFYINGASQNSTTFSAATVWTGLGANTQIGRHGNGATISDFTGIIDEVRISSTARSVDWEKATYDSMNNSMNTFGSEEPVISPSLVWGLETNSGTVTLGKVGTYIPLDGSGVNTNFARFFYLSVSIDGSQSFGYPEDVTRGPTIADISLFFTADPSKRLRHGQTFTGGLIQPLDTPCRVSNGGTESANCPLP